MLVALLVPIPATHLVALPPELSYRLEDLCHPLVFATLAYLVARAMRALGAWTGAMSAIILLAALGCFGAGTEFLQQYTGRDASFSDFGDDVLGSWIGIALFCVPGTRAAPRRALRISIAAAVLLSIAPLGWILAAYTARHLQSPVLWRAGSRLLNTFAQRQQGEYPGLALTEVPPDWHGFAALLVTVRNADARNSVFYMRVDDAHHNQRYEDRYNGEFHISAGTTATYRISLTSILQAPAHRLMDLRRMTSVIVFQLREQRQPPVELLELRLSH